MKPKGASKELIAFFVFSDFTPKDWLTISWNAKTLSLASANVFCQFSVRVSALTLSTFIVNINNVIIINIEILFFIFYSPIHKGEGNKPSPLVVW